MISELNELKRKEKEANEIHFFGWNEKRPKVFYVWDMKLTVLT